MGSENGSESSRHLISHTQLAVEEGYLLAPGKKFGSSSSFSSDTSDSSVEDILQEDASEHNKSTNDNAASPKLDADVQLNLKDLDRGIPSNSSPKSELSDQGSSGLIYPEIISPPGISSPSPYLSVHNESATQSPQVQVMDRSEDSTSYRIPSSVFARSKSKTPMEWSVASNESLFSIHVGNSSFSRDHVFLFGKSDELGKSGELTKSGELMNLPISPLPAAATTDTGQKRVSSGEGFGVTEAAAETMKAVLKAAAEDHDKEETPRSPGEARNSSSLSRHSDASGTSVQSFAFPIKKKNVRPFCYCPNDSQAFCNHTWPICYCSNRSWHFCYRLNCSRTRTYSFASSILTVEGGTGLSKVDLEQQSSHSNTPGANMNADNS